MKLCPEDQRKVLEMAAASIVEELRGSIDFADLVTLPLSFVSQAVGLSPKQAARVLPVRSMGQRTKGVSLRALMDYQGGKKP
jgi:hypothetical protein